MNGVQLAQTAELILELYEHFKIEDFIKCFKNIKTLKYGKFFEGIDGGKIIEMINLYEQEREQEIIEYQKVKNSEYKERAKQTNEILLPILKKVVEKFEVKEVPKARERSEQEKLIDKWIELFDKHWVKEKHVKGSIRFINRYGKKHDLNSFLEYKFKQLKKIY